MEDELRVLSGPPAGAGPSRPEDLPLEVQAAAVLAIGEEAGGEALTDELVTQGLGAVVFFASALRDPAAAARRVGALQAAALRSPVGAPVLVGADQEGGRVCRLPVGFTTMPAAMALGAAADVELARVAGRATAGQLQAVGINWDLAPVCDLWLQDNPALGSRCFSADPHAAAALAGAFVAGLQEGGVLACLKHFPGHGDTGMDSHRDLPVLARSEAELLAREWLHFAGGARAGAASLMLGHLAVPAIDPRLPASLSPAFYRWAREVLGFQGLLVTDALGMGGCVRAAGDVGEAAVLALMAGADMIVVGHGPHEQRLARRAVAEAARDGRLPPARLAEAVGRILSVKRDWGLARRAVPDERGAEHLLARPSDRRLAAEIAARAVTELRPGPAIAAPAFLRRGPSTPRGLVEGAAQRWPRAEVRDGAIGPWLTLEDAAHLLVGPPIPDQLPDGRVLMAYDTVPASVQALLTAAAGEAQAPGRLPR